MDDFITVTAAPLLAKPSHFSDTLFTLPAGSDVETDESLVSEGVLWRHCHRKGKGGARGWIRSDLLERYAHSAEPEPVIVTDNPTDAQYSRGYTAGWNARGAMLAEILAKSKRTE
jgi:hypothetical protein